MHHSETRSTCPDCRGINLMRRKTCPTCGRSLNGALFTLPELPDWMDYRLASWLRGKTPRDIALIASCIPVFIPFPIIALFLMAVTRYRKRDGGTVREWAPILVISIVNITLSILLLNYVSNGLWDILFNWWEKSPGLLPSPQHGSGDAIAL